MRKFIVIILLLCIAVSAVSCTRNDGITTAEIPEIKQTETETETAAETDVETETATEPETETEAETETETEQETEETVINTVYKNGNVTVTEQNGVYTFCDFDNKVILRDEYDAVSELLPGFLLLAKNNLYNLFDTSYTYNNGKKQINGLMFDKMYDEISVMNGIVSNYTFPYNNAAFVVKDGDIEHPFVNGHLYDIDCTCGCYVKEGFLWARSRDVKEGLYYIPGYSYGYNVIYPQEADSVICMFNTFQNTNPDETDRYLDLYLFVWKNGKYAQYYVPDYYNKSAEQITDFVYDQVTRTSDGITYALRDGVQYALDGKGNETRCDLVTLSEADGLKIVKYSAFRNTYGVTDGKGNTIIPPEYWYIEYLDGSFFCSKYPKFEDCSVIDKSGNALTPPHFRFVYGFHAPDNKNTLLIAEYAGELTGNVFKTVLVKSDGSIIIPDLDYYSFEYAENDTYTVSLKNGETCTVNNKGEVIDN
ncbi:MAG: hypothetical protein IKH51_07325 [Clostridia bacterium]|nr:hypothetical protein [Clostridia bacterium]